jgi:hypothetical protein
MGVPKTLGAATVTPGTPTPAVLAAANTPFLTIASSSFSILNGIATIVLSTALPLNGYNGPNGYPVPNVNLPGSRLDIYGGTRGSNNTGGANQGGGGSGQQVTLWGFTTATYFNGISITVLDCNPSTNSFRFTFNHANVASTVDAGKTSPAPFGHYRAIRLECGLGNGTDYVYVGDEYVSSTRYMSALSLAGQLSIEVAGDNIPVERIMIDGTSGTDVVQVSLIY